MEAVKTPPLTLGSRAHVAFQLDGTSLALFIDGKKVNSTERVAVPGNGQRRGVMLGAQMNASVANRFSGKLEEVRISNQLRYQDDFTPAKCFTSDEHTPALYHCDEGQGDKLTDSSSYGHHGKLVGAKWVKVE